MARAVDGVVLAGDPAQPVTGFSIDSRRVTAGDLFVAIRGERFDGHTFVETAIHAGAIGAVVSERRAPIEAAVGRTTPVLIGVRDTTQALQALGKWIRRGSGAIVVAITGSVGKTTTKEAAAELLAARYRVFRNAGNLNNHIGLPLSLLELRHRPEIAVVELGMNHPGEISTLVALSEPDVRVWTNVSEVHTEFFESLEAVADAKAELLEGAGPQSCLVANAADARIMARTSAFPGDVVTFGVDVPADVSATDVETLGIDGMRARLRTRAGEGLLRIPLLGQGHLANVLAASAVALRLGVSLDDVIARASHVTAPARRGEVLKLPSGITIVDDSYNSNPRALERALDVVASEHGVGRRIGVLGEMLELGAAAIALHERCGRAAAAARLDYVITVGGEPAAAMAAAAIAAGMPAARVTHVSTSDEAAERLLSLVRPGDLVLVKGSRGIRTDRVVDQLRAERA